MEHASSSEVPVAESETSVNAGSPSPAAAAADAVIAEPGWDLGRLVQSINPHYAFLVFLPWFIFLMNPNWLFQGFGHMDPWYYFGMSINFPRYQHLNIWYPGERVTWIIPARFFVALFTPAYGWMMFHLCLYWTSTFCVYTLIRRFAGANAALITAAMMASHPMFLAAHGWTNYDSGSIAYLLLTLAALGASVVARNPWPWVVLGGVLWGVTGYTNLFWWVLTPCCVLFYWGTAGKLDLRRCLIAAGCFALGVAITTVFMESVFYGLYGSVNRVFYHSQLDMTRWGANLKKGQTLAGDDSLKWLPAAGWMVFPILTFLIGVVALVRHLFRRRISAFALGTVLAYVYAFLTMSYFTLRPTQVMRYDYYASILVPLEFLVLGVLIFPLASKFSRTAVWCTTIVAAAVVLAPIARPGFYTPGSETNLLWRYIAGFAAMAAGLIWHRKAVWIASVIGISLVSFGLLTTYTREWTYDYNGMAATKRVAEAIQVIDANTAPHTLPTFWINELNDPNTPEFRAIMCSYMSHGFSMKRYPAIDPTKKYPPGSQLILITDERDVFESANAAMTAAGMPLKLRSQHLISGEAWQFAKHNSYWLTFTDVLPAPQTTAAAVR